MPRILRGGAVFLRVGRRLDKICIAKPVQQCFDNANQGIFCNLMKHGDKVMPISNFLSYCRWFRLCAGVLLFVPMVGTASVDADVSSVIAALLAGKQRSLLQDADFVRYQKELSQLYRANAMQLLWAGPGGSEKNLNDALQVLSNAEADGLNPLNYEAERLQHYFRQLAARPDTDLQTLASYDMALSLALLSFMHDVHNGRIDPRGFNYPPPFGGKAVLDAVPVLKKHIEQQNLTELATAVAPKINQYQQLKFALGYYRQQAELPVPADLAFTKALHPGEYDPLLPALRQRLQDLGELPVAEAAPAAGAETRYDEASAAAVMRLQQQQGLHDDGVIGKQTQALLNLKPKEKIALIKLALERLRWLPKQPDGRLILVNIPAFQLWAFNSADDQNALTMKVVVGKAGDTPTPILWEEMNALEFMPYWNIPKSIMDKEILPKLKTNKNYLASQDIELVARYLADAEEAQADNADAGLQHGILRARQRPGKKNPLGKVKFIFPNKADVYMHDTPGHGAFNRDRRDLSHGCVRVAEPEKLAEFVLSAQNGWDKQTIEQAMTGPKTQHVILRKAVPVVFFYNTAYAGQDNKLRFYPDIYGYDEQLQSAINKSNLTVRIDKNTAVDG